VNLPARASRFAPEPQDGSRSGSGMANAPPDRSLGEHPTGNGYAVSPRVASHSS
jgi:hypothetical protein